MTAPDRGENALAFGNPGSTKPPLLSAIGRELINDSGYVQQNRE